jgi:hypothetical protein
MRYWAVAALCTALLSGCKSEEQATCEALTEAWADLYDRCGYTTAGGYADTPEDAAEVLFGARDACERLEEGAFRDAKSLREECVPGLDDVPCISAPVLPPACESQILVDSSELDGL